jgi:hypothetical protein
MRRQMVARGPNNRFPLSNRATIGAGKKMIRNFESGRAMSISAGLAGFWQFTPVEERITSVGNNAAAANARLQKSYST